MIKIGERIRKFIITLFQDEDGVFAAERPSIAGTLAVFDLTGDG